MSDARPFIVVGDRTDHGGTVLEGSPCDTINGKMIARVGDKVHCPRSTCRGAQTIVEGDPCVMVDGSAAAFHGALTSCGARLIASQLDNLIGGSANEEATTEHDWHTNDAALPADESPEPVVYDEQVQLSSPTTEGIAYYIEVTDGRTFSGKTDTSGQLPRIATDIEGEYTIYWADEALAKIDGTTA